MGHRMIFIDITPKGKITRAGAILGIDQSDLGDIIEMTVKELIKLANEKMGEE